MEQDEGGAFGRIAELEAENAALRRALAGERLEAEQVSDRYDSDIVQERAGRAADAAEARSAALATDKRHEQAAAASTADLTASERGNEALRRANADLAASRSALRESEARLQHSERRLQTTQDHAGVGINEIDAEGRYLRINETYTRFSGWTAADLAGRAYWDLIEDEGERLEARRDFGRLVRGEVHRLDAQREYADPGGRRWWAEIAATAVRDEGGRFLYAVRVVQDATERKRAEAALRESERRFAALVRASSDVLYRMSPDWAEMRQLSGGGFIADADAPTRDWLEDYIHPDDQPTVRAAIDDAIRRGGVFDMEHRVRQPDGGFGWTLSRAVPILGADGGVEEWFGAASDVTGRKQAEERRGLLVNELNHRVKNTLAVVQSLALQTARGAADLASFSAAFQARLIALARAHDLLTRTDWEGAPLAEVARTALESSGDRVSLSACRSPDAPLAPAQALALAMALHELATNALKHGALSIPGGRVTVSCGTCPGDGVPFVEWTEQGGPPVPGTPARRGFGLRLLAAQAGVAADLRFEPEGVRCTLRLSSAR